MPAPGAEERENERTRAEAARRRLRPPRRRPKRFRDDRNKDRDGSAEAGQGEAGPSLGDTGRAALAEVMRRYDEGQGRSEPKPRRTPARC